MSDLPQIDFLRQQERELVSLISEAQANGNIVSKMAFRSRLEAVRNELAELAEKDSRTAEVLLLFDGKPVLGTVAIDAKFAVTAVDKFQEIVTKLFAANYTGELSNRGPIKGAELATFNLTGVATGSFGFRLEEKEFAQKSLISSPVREALEQAQELFKEFCTPKDDDFEIDIDAIHPRVFNALGKFFSHLNKNEASLKLKSHSEAISLTFKDIERAYERISAAEVKFTIEEWHGILVGLSPVKRTFDFRKEQSTQVISGKFSQQVSQDYLERIDSEHGVTLGRRFAAKIEVGTIRKPDGTISTSYTALDLNEA